MSKYSPEDPDWQQVQSTLDANPHLGASVPGLLRGFYTSQAEVHLPVLNRAQFFEPEKFHAYAASMGAEEQRNREKGRSRLVPGRLIRQAATLYDNYPRGDLRARADELGLVGRPQAPREGGLSQGHLGLEGGHLTPEQRVKNLGL